MSQNVCFSFSHRSGSRAAWSSQDHLTPLTNHPPHPAMSFKYVSKRSIMQNQCSWFQKTPVKMTESSLCKELRCDSLAEAIFRPSLANPMEPCSSISDKWIQDGDLKAAWTIFRTQRQRGGVLKTETENREQRRTVVWDDVEECSVTLTLSWFPDRREAELTEVNCNTPTSLLQHCLLHERKKALLKAAREHEQPYVPTDFSSGI